MTEPPENWMIFKGTPIEIGAQIFTRLCMPAVRKASNTQGVTPQQLAQLYSGFLQAVYGSMVADFGKDFAVSVATTMLKAFEQTEFDGASNTQ